MLDLFMLTSPNYIICFSRAVNVQKKENNLTSLDDRVIFSRYFYDNITDFFSLTSFHFPQKWNNVNVCLFRFFPLINANTCYSHIHERSEKSNNCFYLWDHLFNGAHLLLDRIGEPLFNQSFYDSHFYVSHFYVSHFHVQGYVPCIGSILGFLSHFRMLDDLLSMKFSVLHFSCLPHFWKVS